jgi:hypothetical protein
MSRARGLLAGDIITSAKLSHDYISHIDLLTSKQQTVHPADEGSAHSLVPKKTVVSLVLYSCAWPFINFQE